MMGSTQNVKMGVCSVVYDGTDLGYTKGGTTFRYAPEYHDVTVDQFGNTPINSYLIGELAEAKVNMAESTLALLHSVCPTATQVVDGNKSKLTFGSKPGIELLSRAKKLVLHPQCMGADKSLDVTIHKAAIKSELNLNYKVDGEYVYEVTFVALVDETKLDGNLLFNIGDESAAADLTAPTISVVPADAASNVPKDITTTVQVTFSKEMNPLTITPGNLLIYQDDTKAVKAGTWAYDAVGKKATFTPAAAWAGSKTFVVIVTTDVRTVNGVPPAAPSITKFTTVA